MITSLDIRSLGVIEEAHLPIGPGLTVLTGETGAGKTMVLTSLHLLLGGRADPAWVRHGAARAEVDGVFEVPGPLIDEVEEAGGSVEDGELIVSRTVADQGRSRAHLGGRMVPATVLAQVTGQLVTVHGQADQLRLRSQAVQRDTLDAHGGPAHLEIIAEYRAAWAAAVATKKRLDVARAHVEDREARIEALQEITSAITSLDPYEGEEEDLRDEAERLTNVEDLRRHAGGAHAMLTGTHEASGAVDLLRQALQELTVASGFDRSVEEIRGRILPALLEIDSACDDLATYVDRLEADPARLAQVHERRAALHSVMRGRASDITELLAWRDGALAELAELTSQEATPQALEAQLSCDHKRVLAAGAELSASRARLAQDLQHRVDAELHGLNMVDASFTVELTPTKPGPHGLEDVAMLLRPHPLAPARPLGHGASGGELSRVMLAIEVVLGESAHSRTFVFDEVDAGIGGRTASEVGARLARLAQGCQVIVVTHLAQVAAFADTHLVVEKNDGTTTVRQVSGEERSAELARMMGSDPASEAARRHAAEVLGQAVPESDR